MQSVMYAYTPDSPEDAKERVMNYAGRMEGGDFQWTFNNEVDDASYEVIAGLKDSLHAYQTLLVSIQGDAPPEIPEPPDSTEVDPADMVHNFTVAGKTSTFYSITGNLSDSKGTVSYAGLTLTQCLKIESSTIISFTAEKEATLTLVFNADYSGRIKVNGTSYNATAGILELTIPAGLTEITKTDVANIYYMILDYGDVVNDIRSQQFIEADEIILYPIPTGENLSISSSVPIERIEIYNLKGARVKSADADVRTINLSKLSTGSYLVRVITADGIYHRTIFKK